MNVADFVYMYKKLQFHNHQNLGFEQLSQPLIKSCLLYTSGAGSSQKEYVLIQPPAVTGKDQSYYGRESIVNVTAELLPELMEKGESFIAFAKSRKNVEIILKETDVYKRQFPPFLLLPARPACCQKDARVPGYPASTAADSFPMSIPSSRALVATRPERCV